MYLIDTRRNGQLVTDAVVNQSIDNYLVNDLKLPGHGFMLYVNRPAVIIGVNQSVPAEVDLSYLAAHHIQLVRRSSGGGAVYHDERNLVFEHIVNGRADDGVAFGDYAGFARPILRTLAAMGVTALSIDQKSSLLVAGKKFSGMTMFKQGAGYAAGGTMMIDLNVAAAAKALLATGNPAQRGVASNRVAITNLRPHLAPRYQKLTIQEFRTAFLQKLFAVDDLAAVQTYHLTAHDWQVIDQRLAEKYGTDAWNYGANPGYRQYGACDLAKGRLHVNFTRRDGQLRRVLLFGPTELKTRLDTLSRQLTGLAATPAALDPVLDQFGEVNQVEGAVIHQLRQILTEGN